MKARSEIAQEYKWDLTKFCANEQDFYQRLKDVESQLEVFAQYEGKLSDDEMLFECLEKEMSLVKEFSLLAMYAELSFTEDGASRSAQEMTEKENLVAAKFTTATSFIDVEISRFEDEKLKALQNNAKFANYKRYFEGVLREKAHTLDKAEELLLSKLSECFGAEATNFDMFSDTGLKFDDIEDSNGKKHPLNQSNYLTYRQSEDRELRKNASKEMLGKYGQFINFLSNNYISNVKQDCVFAKLRKYDSALDRALFDEEVSRKVYDLLIEKVGQNAEIVAKYHKIKQQLLGLDELYTYDSIAPVAKVETKYTYQEAIDLIKNAVSVLGEDYVSLIDKAQKERWIDVFANKNKQSGAFSASTYGATPVVLTNFEGDLDGVFALAHELGHAMHSYYAYQNQPIQTCEYVIFVAEVASIVNEMLLLKYLLENAKTREEKLYFVDYFLREMKAAVFVQTMLSEFECFAHKQYESEEPLSADLLCEKYQDLENKYFAGSIKPIEENKYAWATYSHFYTSFYVYKYATGFLSANLIADKLKNEESFVEKYKKFLSAGGSQDPISLLRIAECDLEDEQTFDQAFEVCRKYLKLFEEA
ncbi:MAG: oligoendopeptidase F [Clostridia bacterium]|nr:oligoendopeptidase F [Clostridia bacterium]